MSPDGTGQTLQRERIVRSQQNLPNTSVGAEGVRATGIEASLGVSLSAERIRATSIEASIATSIATSNAATLAVEVSLSNVLLQTQNTLAATQSSLVQSNAAFATLVLQVAKMANYASPDSLTSTCR